MSMGLGKRYWVHCIKVIFGDLETCIKFMQENQPEDNKQWFELRPIVNVKKGQTVLLDYYQCSLVEDAK